MEGGGESDPSLMGAIRSDEHRGKQPAPLSSEEGTAYKVLSSYTNMLGDIWLWVGVP